MNSNMVKPEKLGYLFLVYHFIVPLSIYDLLLPAGVKRLKGALEKH